jgi:hypothetical protein
MGVGKGNPCAVAYGGRIGAFRPSNGLFDELVGQIVRTKADWEQLWPVLPYTR